jgi:pimeloyl-ACP methyl ester carboxylesterase
MFITQTPAPHARAAGSHPSGLGADPVGTNDTEWVSVGGRRLEVLHLPGGDPQRAPLVFLHEGLGSVAMWGHKGAYWPAALCRATGRRGLVYSRRGYGQSDPIPNVRDEGRHGPDYMHREAFDTLPALLSATGCHRPVLVGHSDGATIALLHASRFPVSACVAMAPHVVVEEVSLRAIEQARDAYLTTPLRDRLARYHRDVDNAFWQWNDVWLSPAFRGFDIRADCARITAPLLLVQGLNDEYGTLLQMNEIQRQAPHAQPTELAHCGHSPHHDQPTALTQRIQTFLALWP